MNEHQLLGRRTAELERVAISLLEIARGVMTNTDYAVDSHVNYARRVLKSIGKLPAEEEFYLTNTDAVP